MLHGLAHKSHHQFIAHGQVEAGLARVPLTAGTTAQLVIDAAGLVALGAQDIESARFAHLIAQALRALFLAVDLGFPGLLVLFLIFKGVEAAFAQLFIENDFRVTAEHDIGTTAGHVGCHGHGARAARTGNDLTLFFVVLGIEHVVLHAALAKQLRQILGALHRGGTHQDRLAMLDVFCNIINHRGELCLLGLVNAVRMIGALVRLIGRNRNHIQPIDGMQLRSFRFRGTGHAGNLFIEAEEVLQGNRRQRLVLVFDLHLLLGLNGLVHALVVAASCQNAAGKAIHDHHFAVADDVVLIAGK